jgi:hypothetical protein
LARAPALHAGGQGFDSLILHADYGLRIGDYVSQLVGKIKNPKSEIRNRNDVLFKILKFGIGQSPDGKWDSGVSLPLISQVERHVVCSVRYAG